MAKEEITIFVGSPGDVEEERKQVFKLIDDLDRDPGLEPYFRIKGIGWDRTPYVNNTWLSPQRAIAEGLPPPADCDVAVFLFWSRVGTPLDRNDFDDVDPAAHGFVDMPITGSTWELLNAITVADKQQRPVVITFRCKRRFPSGKDASAYLEQGKQLEGLEALFNGFKSGESYRHSYTEYDKSADLKEQLNGQLRAFLQRRREAQATRSQQSLAKPTPIRRRVQLDWLAALLGKLEQRPVAKDRIDESEGVAVPLLVCGEEAEWHEALARQLKALVSNYDPALSKPVPVPGWHDNTDLNLRKLNLTNELRGHIGLEPLGRNEGNSDDQLRAGISSQLDRFGNEVFHYRLFADRWAADELELIRWWMDFWLDIRLSRKGQNICALLSIEVPEPEGFFGRLLNRNRPRDRVEGVFDVLGKDARYAPYLLSKLESPTWSSARDWSENQLAKVPGIESERDAYVKACEALFTTRDAIPHRVFRDDWIERLGVQSR